MINKNDKVDPLLLPACSKQNKIHGRDDATGLCGTLRLGLTGHHPVIWGGDLAHVHVWGGEVLIGLSVHALIGFLSGVGALRGGAGLLGARHAAKERGGDHELGQGGSEHLS